MTVAAVLLSIALVTLFGVVPTLLLVPRTACGSRLLLMPLLGTSVCIIVTTLLAFLGLTGEAISIMTLTLFSVGIVALCIRGPLLARHPHLLRWKVIRCLPGPAEAITPQEWRRAGWVLVVAAAVTVLVIWPYLHAGLFDYWGLGNPDESFYMKIIDRLQHHRFGMPTMEETYGVTHANASAILGISYLASIISILTSVPAKFLFGTLCGLMIFLNPLAAYCLAEFGFRAGFRTSLLTAATIGCSAVITGAFYIDALGSLSVNVLAAAGVAVCVRFIDQPSHRLAVLFALLTAGMCYSYYPGFGVLGAICGLAVAVAVVRGKLSPRNVLHLVAVTGALLVATSFTHFTSILRQLVLETFSGRLRVTSDSEVLLDFGRFLTEQMVPFLWGLSRGNTVGYQPVFGIPFLVLFGAGLLFTAILFSAAVRYISGLQSEYGCVLLVIVGLLSAYTYTGNGYGVFKLVSWLQPFILLGFVATITGTYRILRARAIRRGAALVFVPLLFWFGLNVRNTVASGIDTIHKDSPSQNARGYELRDFRRLEELDAKWGGVGFNMALPDFALQLWTIPFLHSRHLQFFPIVRNGVEDSTSRAAELLLRDAAQHGSSSYLLRGADIVEDRGVGDCAPVWSDGAFQLVDLRTCLNLAALGPGWYRLERDPAVRAGSGHMFRWLRKQGQLLLFHPSDGPLRIQFSAAVGFGNPSSDRTIRLFLNRQLFDTIRISGFAQVISKPFLARPPWARIDFEIQEEAQPLPRGFALWNRWVPGDPRRLNVAFSAIRILARTAEPPSRTSVDLHSPAEIAAVNRNGIFGDRWVGSEADVELLVPTGSSDLVLRGMVPGNVGFSFPYTIRVFADDVPLGEARVEMGNFQAHYSLKKWLAKGGEGARNVHLHIETQATFEGARLGLSHDKRSLSVMLDSIAVR